MAFLIAPLNICMVQDTCPDHGQAVLRCLFDYSLDTVWCQNSLDERLSLEGVALK